jgi:transcriptional regulator with XRE-family HTH domain
MLADMDDLGEFLRSRRARLRPEDVGLVDYGDRRRVPGLRREELAQLAGVSVGYYTRLEQGQSRHASEAVLDAVAAVLRLDDDERTHLHVLARPKPKARRRPRPERVHPRLTTLVDSLAAPAIVLGRHTDVLAWNQLGHALLAGHLDRDAPTRADRPNWARLFFLDPHVVALFGDGWLRKARDTVSDLRMIAARRPDDLVLAELVGELSMHSTEFAALWAAHPVRGCAHHTRDYHHPLVGPLTLTDDLMTLPDDEGQRLAVFYAEPGSSSAVGLDLLGRVGSPSALPVRADSSSATATAST